MFEFEEELNRGAKIKVVGIGGGGGNSINRMIASNMVGVEFVAINTDAQVLRSNSSPTKIQIGSRLTKGLGAGAVPEIGRKAAEEDKDRVMDALAGADMVFITAGMGGGTGTGASPIVAEISKAVKALTVAVVTKPFNFEGKTKSKIAQAGIEELKEKVDTLITIPNERLISISGNTLPFVEAFAKADEVLKNAVSGISELITVPGLINVDFADVKTIMSNMGGALMGIGHGSGEKRALNAAEAAITSPLLEDISIDGARGILVNVACGPDLTITEIDEAIKMIHKKAHPDVHIIFGARIEDTMYNDVKITVIATGFEKIAKIIEEKASESAQVSTEKTGEETVLKQEETKEEEEQIKLPDMSRRMKDYVKDDLETPTYMRRHAEMHLME